MTHPLILPLLFSLSRKDSSRSDPSPASNPFKTNETPFQTVPSSSVPDATPNLPPEKPLTSIELNRSFFLDGNLARTGEVAVTINRSDTLQTVFYEIEFPSACLVHNVQLDIGTPLSFVPNEDSPVTDGQRPLDSSEASSGSTPAPIPSLTDRTAKVDDNASIPTRARRPRSGRGERPSLVRPSLEATRKISISDIQFDKDASSPSGNQLQARQLPFIEWEKYYEIKIRYVEEEGEYEPIIRLLEANQSKSDKSSKLSSFQSIPASTRTDSAPTNHQRCTFPVSPTDRIALAEDFDLPRISVPDDDNIQDIENTDVKESTFTENSMIRPTSPMRQSPNGSTPHHRSSIVTALNFRVLGIAKRIVIEIKLLNPINKGDIPIDTNKLQEHTRRIGIYGHSLNETPEAKAMLPLLNIAGKLKTEGNVRHAVEAYILCALSFQSGRKYIQSVELIDRAQKLMQPLVCADVPSSPQSLENPPFSNNDTKGILRMAKLEALAAEILYINGREYAAVPRFWAAADYWREYCRRESATHKRKDSDAKKDTDSEDEDSSEDTILMNHGSNMQSDQHHCAFMTDTSSDRKFSSVPEILYHRCEDLTELFLSSLTDHAEYSRNVALNGLQFMIEAIGCRMGRHFIPVVSSLFSIYTLREEIHSNGLRNAGVEAHGAVQSTNRLIWVIESSFQLIPKFSPEVLAELIESWGWPLISCRRGHEPMAHIYRFLYLALANATTCDLRIPHAVLDAILRDAIESSSPALSSSIAPTNSSGNHDGCTGDPTTELRTAAAKFWGLVVATVLSVPEGNRTLHILQYIANQLSMIAAASHPNNGEFSLIHSAEDLLTIRETAIGERKIALYLDVLDRLSFALKDGRVVRDLHAWAREQAAMNLVEVLVVLMELLEIRLVQKNQTLFENVWTSVLYIWEAIPAPYHRSISTTVISLLEHFIITIREFSPTECALKALATILGSLELDVEMIQMLQGTFLPAFCERIPHSTYDESFHCLGSLLFILRDNFDSASLDVIINCLVDRFTIPSEARNQAVRRFITVVLSHQLETEESFEYEYPYLEWMIRKCLLQNPILTADSTKKCLDTKHQLTEQDLSVEMLVMTDILFDAAKPYHAGHVGKDGNFVGLLALFAGIIGACHVLIKHSDLKVVRCAFGIMTGLFNILLEKQNRQHVPLLSCYPDGIAVCVKFLCAVAVRATCDDTLTISVLAALRFLLEKYASIIESDDSKSSQLKFPLLSSDTWKISRQLFDSPSRAVRAATLGTLMRIIPIRRLSEPLFSSSSESDLAVGELDLLLKQLLTSRSWDANHHGLRLLLELSERYTELVDGSATEFISLFPNSYQCALDLQDNGRAMIRASARELTEYLDKQIQREDIEVLSIDLEVVDYTPPLTIRDGSLNATAVPKPFLPSETDLTDLNAAWRSRSKRFGLQPHQYQVYWWNKMDLPKDNTEISSSSSSPLNGPIQSNRPVSIPFIREPESMKEFTDPNTEFYVLDVYVANKITSTLDPHTSGDGGSQQISFIDDGDDFQELGIIEMNEDWSGDEDNEDGRHSPTDLIHDPQPDAELMDQ